MIKLRPRQAKALNDLRAAYGMGYRAPLLVAPTGMGKTTISIEIIRSAISKGGRVWFVAHLREILQDTATRLEQAGIRFGWIMANKKEVPDAPVQLVSIQSFVKRPDPKYLPNFVIIDECHLSVTKSYKSLIERCGYPKLLGLSATPERLSGEGLNEVYDYLVHTCSTGDLIKEDLLAPIRYYAPHKPDLSNVRTVNGEYETSGLRDYMFDRHLMLDMLKWHREHAAGRVTVAFCITIEHATAVRDFFKEHGYRASVVSSESKRAEREEVLADLRAGKIDIACNVGLYIAGIDVPNIGALLLVRPTQSLTVFLQSVGRGLRVHDDLEDLVVLDFAGNVFKHGMPEMNRIWSLEGRQKREKDNDEPTVTECSACFRCYERTPGQPRICPYCGHQEEPEEKEQVAAPDIVLEQITEVILKKRHPAAGCRTLEELLQRAKELGYKPEWAYHVWRNRQKNQWAGKRRYNNTYG